MEYGVEFVLDCNVWTAGVCGSCIFMERLSFTSEVIYLCLEYVKCIDNCSGQTGFSKVASFSLVVVFCCDAIVYIH